MILLAASLTLLAWTAARLGAATSTPGDARVTTALRAALWAFATLVAVETVLGAAGCLQPRTTLAALAGVAAAVEITARRRQWRSPVSSRSPTRPWSTVEAALAAALLAALVLRLGAGLGKQSFLYDTLSFHMFAPATWIRTGRLAIVPAVFGDPAPAYNPSNVELWFAFLMAPLRSDYLASAGQLPFAALGAFAVAAAVRESGGPRAGALGAALAFLLVPEVWQQAPTAMVDLAMAALLASAVALLARLARRAPAAGDLAALGLALGLAAGSKYVALAYELPLLGATAVLLVRWWRRRALPAGAPVVLAAALAAGGGFWYARNLIVSGNPLYPLAIRIGSRTIFAGLYDGATMRAWDYHLPIADVAALGGMLLEAGAGFCAGAVLALARTRRSGWGPLAIALLAIFWLVVPYQHSRFLFPVHAVLAMAMGAAAGRAGPAWLAWAPLALAIGGALLEYPAPDRLALLVAALLGVAVRATARRLPARAARRIGAGVAAAALAAGAAALAVGLERHRAHPPPFSVGDELDDAWAWFTGNVRGARVAYTGVNLPFPLVGADLANAVSYVNVAGAPGDQLHHFAREPAPTAEPAPYRDGAGYDTWLSNLRAAGTEVLFVSALYPIVRRTIAADSDGFPIERAWADAHPAIFHLRYASAAARVYGVSAGGAP